MTKLEQTLANYCDELSYRNYDVLCVCVNGSQCYNLDDEESDIDAIAWVIPSLDDLMFGGQPKRSTIQMDEGLCTVWDIRYLVEAFEKGQFLQYLPFWETKYVPHRYRATFSHLFDTMQKLAYYNFKAITHKIQGMAITNTKLTEKFLSEGNIKRAGKCYTYVEWLNFFLRKALNEYSDYTTFRDDYKVSDETKANMLPIKRGLRPEVVNIENVQTILNRITYLVDKYQNSKPILSEGYLSNLKEQIIDFMYQKFYMKWLY